MSELRKRLRLQEVFRDRFGIYRHLIVGSDTRNRDARESYAESRIYFKIESSPGIREYRFNRLSVVISKTIKKTGAWD